MMYVYRLKRLYHMFENQRMQKDRFVLLDMLVMYKELMYEQISNH